ncbi:MAG: MATE family efflux transporter [Solirubrobacterales bacterium]
MRRAAAREKIAAAISFNRSLLVNAGSMMGTALATSGLGVIFWLVAAHYFSQSAVGIASASTSAMTLLGFFATLGLGTLLMGELPRRTQGHRPMVNAAFAVTAATGSVLGLAFALIVPQLSDNLTALHANVASTAFFAVGVGLTAAVLVLDQALIGLLRGGLQFSRNVVFALVKLLALIPVALLIPDAGAAWIYSAWTLGIAVSMVVLVRFYTNRGADNLRPDFGLLKDLRRSAFAHHLFNLAAKTPDLLIPVLVVVLVSAAANASFYIAWMVAGFIFMVPWSLSTMVYAIGSGEHDRLAERFRFTVRLSVAFGLLANALLFPTAGPLLGIFGARYAAAATTPLHILALGVFGDTVRMHFIAVHRVEHRIGPALPIIWLATVFELLAAAVGASLGGLEGVAIGWVGAVSLEGVFMARDVRRAMRPSSHIPSAEDRAEIRARLAEAQAAPIEPS